MYNFVKSPVNLFDTSGAELLESAVRADHPFRIMNELVDFDRSARTYRPLYSKTGTKGIPIEQAMRLLIIQWLEDYSDREMERAVQENLAIKWFCGFDLADPTPDHSFFGKFRTRLGTKNLGDIFQSLNDCFRAEGLIGDTFSFVDATGIVTKTALWDERDRALRQGETTVNNRNVQQFAADSQARFGAKGKNKHWYGYKRHQCVDAKQGLVTKVAVTPANVLDDQAAKHVAPRSGMALEDKGYDTPAGRQALVTKGIHAGIIRKNNVKEKNHDLDAWISKLRMPFEGSFSKLHRRAKYRSLVKVQFQAFAEAIAFNLKRVLTVYLARAALVSV
jgi:IS5 family transposase